MRPTVISILGLAALLVFSGVASAQKLELGKEPGLEVPEVTAGPGWKTCPRCQNNEHVRAARERYKVNGHPFNPRDLSGVWGNNGINLDIKTLPAMTPYGKELWEATQAVQVRPEIPPMNGGQGSKDPMMHCDPLGYPRSFTYNYGFEFVQLPDRMIQFFEWGGYHRTIWTDGRKLPADPPQARWYGYSVGRWEGDTFVVESHGFEDRSWLDQDRRSMAKGMPHSDEMRLVERWKRTNYGTLDVELTIIDPKVYVTPWITKSTVDLRPGAELSEYWCVPTDSEEYNRDLVR
jgi:hypothetical protein